MKGNINRSNKMTGIQQMCTAVPAFMIFLFRMLNVYKRDYLRTD